MPDRVVSCELCPKRCRIGPSERGDCRIRINLDGRLLATTFGLPSAVHLDPIEKKPLYHFLPGSTTFSVATVGCNLHCRNCQNWEISQANPEDAEAFALPPDALVRAARDKGCSSVAFTYTEPLVYYEYTLETARVGRAQGLRNVIVTAGYLNRRPLEEIYRVIDASNTDLKALDERFYRDVCDATLAPVLDGLELAKARGVWLEITNLLIPGLNDEPAMVQRMCRWIVTHLGQETPLHFSRFQPRHLMQDRPPTPLATLRAAREIARAEGIEFVYLGNVGEAEGQTTTCPRCGTALIRRVGYRTDLLALDAGRCRHCGREIPGVWS